MDIKLKEKLGKRELTWLKEKAKTVGISADKNQSESQQIYTLLEKLSVDNHLKIINELNKSKNEIINEAKENSIELMRWLYSNQGEMRFGAENRLFVILVDSTDMAQSWKMKRAFPIIEKEVNAYLDNFSNDSLKEIPFNFKGNCYKALADVIFVIK